jgi:N utilization substance protein B
VTEPRELAVQVLYEADQLGLTELAAHGDISAKAARLAAGTFDRRAELDRLIDEVSDRWRVDRMPVVDRAVLRLALYELTCEPGTPTGVVLSEAVRIAKMFSTERSGQFVNGVLGTLARQVRPD